jgi:hypothetical protein
MYAQLGTKVMCKIHEKIGIPSNFYEFLSEEVHYKKY